MSDADISEDTDEDTDEKKSIEDRISKKTSNKDEEVDPETHPLKFIDDYTPDKDDMAQKGDLKRAMTTLFPSADAMLEVFENDDLTLEETMKLTKEWLTQVEKRQISVKGKSREDFKDIYKALLGSYSHSEKDQDKSFMQSVFGADRGEKDEG